MGGGKGGEFRKYKRERLRRIKRPADGGIVNPRT